ncbi:MAG: DNA-protecting protein DprA [Acidobacteria bacterium]|uniref:DNA-protecting protein DprA n=1 Tax=Candidatus Polarisedimenticola svalbardensis TaxID=2886004 RepID=A0A8J7C2P9_9BACT|nr:DNA-protecting protein DprA [Candidatus Polarisedimenticola svalbardensis]
MPRDLPAGDLPDWIALNFLPSLGPVRISRALEAGYSPGDLAYRVPAGKLSTLARYKSPNFAERLREVRKDLRRTVHKEMKRCRELGIDLLPVNHPNYPEVLLEIPDPPVLLYLRGELPEDVLRVALVGSRNGTRYGLSTAETLARDLARFGVEPVSGGARGVDTAAHCGALKVGGKTVAVLGSGLGTFYPPENKQLFEEIAAGGGCLVSEFPLMMGPMPGHFPRRNRLISGLSAAVVVVEATRKSGSLITAGHALEQGREVLAVPGPVTSPTSTGCNLLLRSGARPALSARDILEELQPAWGHLLENRADSGLSEGKGCSLEELLAELPTDERKVLEYLDPVEPSLLDEMAEGIPMRIAPIQVALFGLTARGLVDQLPGRYYLRRPLKES